LQKIDESTRRFMQCRCARSEPFTVVGNASPNTVAYCNSAISYRSIMDQIPRHWPQGRCRNPSDNGTPLFPKWWRSILIELFTEILMHMLFDNILSTSTWDVDFLLIVSDGICRPPSPAWCKEVNNMQISAMGMHLESAMTNWEEVGIPTSSRFRWRRKALLPRQSEAIG
jgi:hypothetical protein